MKLKTFLLSFLISVNANAKDSQGFFWEIELVNRESRQVKNWLISTDFEIPEMEIPCRIHFFEPQEDVQNLIVEQNAALFCLSFTDKKETILFALSTLTCGLSKSSFEHKRIFVKSAYDGSLNAIIGNNTISIKCRN